MAIVAEELHQDRKKCHEVAHTRTSAPRSSVAADGGGTFIGAVLTQFRVIGAVTRRDPLALPLNSMCRPRIRSREGRLRPRYAKIFFDRLCGDV